MKPACAPAFLCLAVAQAETPAETRPGLRGVQARRPAERPHRQPAGPEPGLTLGGLQVAERFTDGEGPDLLAELIKQIARADRRIHRPLFQKASYLGRGDFREVFYRLIAEAITQLSPTPAKALRSLGFLQGGDGQAEEITLLRAEQERRIVEPGTAFDLPGERR